MRGAGAGTSRNGHQPTKFARPWIGSARDLLEETIVLDKPPQQSSILGRTTWNSQETTLEPRSAGGRLQLSPYRFDDRIQLSYEPPIWLMAKYTCLQTFRSTAEQTLRHTVGIKHAIRSLPCQGLGNNVNEHCPVISEYDAHLAAQRDGKTRSVQRFLS